MISGVYKSRFSNVLRVVQENSLIFILFALFSSGLIFGTIIIKNDSLVVDRAVELVSTYIKFRGSQTVFETACSSFITNLIHIIPIFIFGLCAVGIPATLSIPFVRGVGIGFISAFFYTTYGLNGLGHCILVIFPGAMFSVLILILSSQIATVSSANIFRRITVGNTQEIKLIAYCKRFLVYFCGYIIIGLLDGILNKIFSNIFII